MRLTLFFLSALVLTVEVLETKIFAYSLANNMIFLVIGVVLLGFGAGGTALSLKPKLEDPRELVGRNLLWTAVLLIVAHAWFALFSDRLVFSFEWRSFSNLREFVDAYLPLLTTLSILVLLASPYFFAGMAISAMLAEAEGSVHLRYGINLLGSAVGCVTIFFILGPLTGPECLAVCAILCALLAVPWCKRRVGVGLAIAILGVPTFVFADEILPYRIQPDPGQLDLIVKNAKRIVDTVDSVSRADVVEKYDRWDPTARVQVHAIEAETSNPKFRAELESTPSMWFTQDSSYGSPLIGVGENPEGTKAAFDRTCYGIGYFRGRPKPKVLVIGLGGAPDIQSALHHDAAAIQGVDINRTTVRMVQSEGLAEFLGKPYADERVSIAIQDGRSYVSALEPDRVFDLIQLSGVDTKSVLASGTLALNESYLYTEEAIGDYVSHLAPDGILCILYSGDTLRDRFAATAMSVLRERFEASGPHKHLMMVEQSKIFCFLVKRSPFTPEECRSMDAWIERADSAGKTDKGGQPALDGKTDVHVLVYELLNPGLSLNNAPAVLFMPDGRSTDVEIMRCARRGEDELERFIEAQEFNISPAPDSRPFFFNIVRSDQILAELWEGGPMTHHFRELFMLLLVMMALSVVLITGPLLVFGARGNWAAWRNIPFALYFACLGAGFVLAMSGLIQRYVLFLGHQGYAFPTVIGGLLVAAGIGSMLSRLFRKKPHVCMLVATVAICFALAGIQLYLDSLFDATAQLPMTTRVLVSVLVLVPLGVPLGMMFPTGLEVVKQSSPLFVPWAFGINGVFSVIGSTIVLPGAILYGFPRMSIAAGAVYVLAAMIGFPLARSHSR